MARLDGKRIVITGGNSGIGLASAQAFAREGGKILLLGRDQETLQAAKDSLGDASVGYASDGFFGHGGIAGRAPYAA